MSMRITIPKNLLSAATSRVQGAITERSLAQIGLHADHDKLQVAATDRILAIYSSLQCLVEESGTVFVPARLFSDVVKELPDGQVRLLQEGSYLLITAGQNAEFEMKLPLIDDLTWREPPAINTRNTAELPSARLTYMIDQVQFCVAQDSPRNYGSVAYLHKAAKSNFRLVGTDGFRLSYSELETSLPEGFLTNGVCLSKRALTELQRMCNEGFETVRLSISEDETTLVAEVPDYRIYVRLSAVKYPNYLGVIPNKKMAGVNVSRPQLATVARRVLLAADKSRALQLSFSDSSLTLNSKTMGSSEGRETVPLSDYRGPRFDVAVNGKFLTDVFATTDSQDLTLQFNQESNEDPVVIVPCVEPSNCKSKHVLVPIKQND
jgi:DNA polymerase-3 subunit beta